MSAASSSSNNPPVGSNPAARQTGPLKTYQHKLVLLGESAVGKSSLVLRFVRGQFPQSLESTIGAAFLTQSLPLSDCTIKFEIWDTAGQERYHSLAPMYYRGAAAALVVYDITDGESFGRAKEWVKELQRQANPAIVIALVGNKKDLLDEAGGEESSSKRQRAVATEDAQMYAEENHLLFYEASAKSGENVNEIFVAVGKKLPRVEPMQARSGRTEPRINLGASRASNDRPCC